MSKEQFNDDCPGCKPVIGSIVDGKMKTLPADSPIQAAVDRMWAKTSFEERKAFHNFTCLNSRDPAVMAVMERLNAQIQKELDDAGMPN